jgi:hypothetical protein
LLGVRPRVDGDVHAAEAAGDLPQLGAWVSIGGAIRSSGVEVRMTKQSSVRRDHRRSRSGWIAPPVDGRRWADQMRAIHDALPPVPDVPRGAETPPRNPDEQCWWCLCHFGVGVTDGGTLWNGNRICQRCADTVDGRRA